VHADISWLILHFCMIYRHFAWKGRPQNDLYCVQWYVKPYTHTYPLSHTHVLCDLQQMVDLCAIEADKFDVKFIAKYLC